MVLWPEVAVALEGALRGYCDACLGCFYYYDASCANIVGDVLIVVIFLGLLLLLVWDVSWDYFLACFLGCSCSAVFLGNVFVAAVTCLLGCFLRFF